MAHEPLRETPAPADPVPPRGESARRETLTSNVTDVALVFEGGGMRGSLTSAVPVVLLEAGIHLDWVAGISAGSSHTCNYLSRDTWRARASFTDLAGDPRFGSMRTWLQGKGLFHAEFIYEAAALPGGPLPFDWDTFHRNPARSRIIGFRADDGVQEVWTEADFTTPKDLMMRARASSTMPVVMPNTRIGTHTYVDGALGDSGGIPLDVAIAEGFERFFVVLSQPRDHVRRPLGAEGFYRRRFREFPAVAEALASRHERYNATREQIFALEAEGRALVFVPEVMPVSNGERNVAKLTAAHQLGLDQARRELPRWREFLGV